MFGFTVKTLQNGFGSPRSPSSLPSPAAHGRVEPPAVSSSPKADVGEIDTRAPFESVKAAVSLFGEVLSPRARPVTKKTKAEEVIPRTSIIVNSKTRDVTTVNKIRHSFWTEIL